MCRLEVFGDWHRGCGHFIKSYYSGEQVDCNNQYCFHSSAHTHLAPNCSCTRETEDERRIVNMFHAPCDDCRAAEFARRVGR
ncbi:hypothetical protein FA15DRAFT_636268 [Coprinopsis marcescibilis]|uniref:Uncharacterized protein n=1 Tax=Coprinopsis marcescibilis TaxID=230819 RepID=A0A5C3L3K9_COPMA|nr:hypothetical protein FA15DRAFT_636268 [Coprinopsis marcescibilis]